MKYRWTALILLLIFDTAAAVGQATTSLAQTVMASEQNYIAAAKKSDVAFFKRALADDFSFVGVDGQLSDRQEMIDQRTDDRLDVQPYNMKVVAAGEDTAIVTYDAIVRVPPSEDQGPPPRYQHFSTVWVKQGDAWKMKFQQTTAAHWGDW